MINSFESLCNEAIVKGPKTVWFGGFFNTRSLLEKLAGEEHSIVDQGFFTVLGI